MMPGSVKGHETLSTKANTAVIDCHLHVWDTNDFSISWTDGTGLPEQSKIPDSDSPGRRYVLVEADADDPRAETSWLTRYAERDPRIHGLVVSVLLEQASAQRELNRIGALPAVVGVRRLLQDRDLFESPGLLTGLQELARHELPFDACVRADELPALFALIKRVPELTVVLDHMGKPPVQNAGEQDAEHAMERWRSDIARLADLPQVHCKLSGLPAECRDQTQLEAVAGEIVTYAYELFGPQRCLIGSDRPVSHDSSGKNGHGRDWCERVLSLIPEEHRETVGHQNATHIYRRRS